jgi:glutamate dehydrogenase
MVRTTPGSIPAFDRKELEARLAAAARRWPDQLRDALVDAEGEARGIELFKRWGAAFPSDYRERVPARGAVSDVRKIASLSTDSPLALALYRPLGAGAGALGFKVYRLGQPVVLSDSLPMLEHMGVRVLGEQHASVETADTAVSLHDFELEVQGAGDIEPETMGRLFEDAFARVFRGDVENDDFNRLVLRAGLAADEVVVLRAYAKYLKQIGFALSQATIETTLGAHPRIARMLVGLFRLRFDPDKRDEQGATAQVNAIEQALEKVANLSEDRVLRQLLALIQATLRTNFWTPAAQKRYFSAGKKLEQSCFELLLGAPATPAQPATPATDTEPAVPAMPAFAKQDAALVAWDFTDEGKPVPITEETLSMLNFDVVAGIAKAMMAAVSPNPKKSGN